MAQLIGTDIELLVASYLTKHNIPFQFQTSLSGGFYQLGGSVVDFILSELMIALRVQGDYWHQGINKEGMDLIQKESLKADGYIVVDIWGDNIQSNFEETMRLALQGIEMTRG